MLLSASVIIQNFLPSSAAIYTENNRNPCFNENSFCFLSALQTSPQSPLACLFNAAITSALLIHSIAPLVATTCPNSNFLLELGEVVWLVVRLQSVSFDGVRAAFAASFFLTSIILSIFLCTCSVLFYNIIIIIGCQYIFEISLYF